MSRLTTVIPSICLFAMMVVDMPSQPHHQLFTDSGTPPLDLCDDGLIHRPSLTRGLSAPHFYVNSALHLPFLLSAHSSPSPYRLFVPFADNACSCFLSVKFWICRRWIQHFHVCESPMTTDDCESTRWAPSQSGWVKVQDSGSRPLLSCIVHKNVETCMICKTWYSGLELHE